VEGDRLRWLKVLAWAVTIGVVVAVSVAFGASIAALF
jgi:hypothetical protein